MIIFIPVFIFIILLLRRIPGINNIGSNKIADIASIHRKHYVILLLISLAMLSISYAFDAFKPEVHFPPVAVAGDTTSIHIAGSIGTAFIFASLISLLDMMLTSKLVKNALFLMLASYLAVLISFGILIQEYYVKTWRKQINTWRQILALTPDAGRNTVVIVRGQCLYEGTYASAYTQTESSMFRYLFNIKKNVMPKTFFICSEKSDVIALVFIGGSYRLNYTKFAGLPAGSRIIDANNTILLEWDNSILRRKYILKEGASPSLILRHKVLTEPVDRSLTRKLYNYMFADS